MAAGAQNAMNESGRKALLGWTLAAIVALCGVALPRALDKQDAVAGSAREQLIGAWHLVAIRESGADASSNHVTDIKGTLIYTRDGHMSVQLMYPPSGSSLSNDYVKDGYEASFGTYDLNEAAHTVTHHVQGSVTRALVGKDLTRKFRFSDGRMIIESTRPDEPWSVTWEHY
jgi:Lipocalin-like domain